RALFEAVLAVARAHRAERVCIVSTFRVHLGDRAAARCEAALLAQLRGLPAAVSILRPAHVLSRNSRLAAFLKDSSCWLPLLPNRLQGCCVGGEELFAAIDQELAAPGPRRGRVYTLLGQNRPWRDYFRNYRQGPLARAYVALTAALPPLALFRRLARPVGRAITSPGPPVPARPVETVVPRPLPGPLAPDNTSHH